MNLKLQEFKNVPDIQVQLKLRLGKSNTNLQAQNILQQSKALFEAGNLSAYAQQLHHWWDDAQMSTSLVAPQIKQQMLDIYTQYQQKMREVRKEITSKLENLVPMIQDHAFDDALEFHQDSPRGCSKDKCYPFDKTNG